MARRKRIRSITMTDEQWAAADVLARRGGFYGRSELLAELVTMLDALLGTSGEGQVSYKVSVQAANAVAA